MSSRSGACAGNLTKSRCLIAALVMGLAAPVPGQQIYKWIDDKGVTHYTTTPPPGGKAQIIKAQPAIGGSAPGAKSWQDQEREFRARQVESAESQRKQDEAENRAAQLRAACAAAQRDLRVLQEDQRLVRLNEKGERQYLDEAQREQAARKAKAFIDQQCPR